MMPLQLLSVASKQSSGPAGVQVIWNGTPSAPEFRAPPPCLGLHLARRSRGSARRQPYQRQKNGKETDGPENTLKTSPEE